MPQPAKLALADGTIYTGTAFGASGEVFGEVCFNTSMTGYQEILTDPSYCGQIVTMTYPLIGNYGINSQDDESNKLSIASGPTAGGLYKVRVAVTGIPKAELARIVKKLQEDKVVGFIATTD